MLWHFILKRGLICTLPLGLFACSNQPHFTLAKVEYISFASLKSRTTPGTTYVVQEGDTLFSIAWEFGMNVADIVADNGLTDESKIFAKQTLYLYSNRQALPEQKPDKVKQPLVVKVRPDSDQKKTRKAQKKLDFQPVTRLSSNQQSRLKNNQTPARASSTVIPWRWPVASHTVKPKSIGKGIDVKARRGEPVHAAASGKVVYVGNALRGYGNLVIIKHQHGFLSAYAHNDRVLVKKAQIVQQGQHVADVGSSGTDEAKLHFEIRLNGRPVDPLKYLP
ncbi:MAG: peptidoglycan DD-metalloendopeptidase family protein [Shewanellaceae bacterium]|nr:peptidoglycan DD-metalloendopeptidase family protein [Shewanellaceae bacterium]